MPLWLYVIIRGLFTVFAGLIGLIVLIKIEGYIISKLTPGDAEAVKAEVKPDIPDNGEEKKRVAAIVTALAAANCCRPEDIEIVSIKKRNV